MSKNVIINGTTYSGISIVSLPTSSGTATFKDEGEITVPSGTIQISTNGTHNVKAYENAIVNVPVGVAPSGSITVTENGTFDVTNYASVVVNVPSNSELTLKSISATYSGGTVAAGTTVEQLTGITVTATYTATGYTGNITKAVTGYSLSGTLNAGQTNTVTVTYLGKTTTFNVTVNAEVTLTGITVNYTGGTVAAGTTLEQLTGITVTANYSDSSTSTVPSSGYSLSGALTPGQTNTITVSYSGKTATFEVTVEAESSTETYDLIWNNTTSTANDVSMTGFNTLGSTYDEALSAVTPNKYAAVSNLITYNSSKTYMFKATTLYYGLRFQYGFFDASGNLVAYTDFDAIGDVGTTVPTTITLNGSTVTRNKNGTINTEIISTSSVANIAVFVRGKRAVPHGSDMSSVENATTMYAFEWSVSG